MEKTQPYKYNTLHLETTTPQIEHLYNGNENSMEKKYSVNIYMDLKTKVTLNKTKNYFMKVKWRKSK